MSVKPTWLDESTTIRKSDHTDMPRASRIRFGGLPDTALSYDPVTGEVIVDLSAVISGGSGTGVNVNYTGVVNLGDVLTSAGDNTDPTKVQVASTANLATGATVRGVAAQAPASGKVLMALPGSALPTTVTSLTASSAGYVVANASGRCVKKQPPSFADAIVGFQDSNGLLHVLPQKSRVAQEYVDPRDYGAVGDGTTDDTVALAAAVQAAHDLAMPLFIPAGTFVTSKPLRVKWDKYKIHGVQREQSIIKSKLYSGPIIYVSSDASSRMHVTTSGGAVSGTGYLDANAAGPSAYALDMSRCNEISISSGRPQICIQRWVKMTAAVTGGNSSPIASSSGAPYVSTTEGTTRTTAWALYLTGNSAFSTGDNTLIGYVTINGVLVTLHSTSGHAVPVGSWAHLLLDYDGSTVRLGINGTIVATASASGNVTKGRWETAFEGGFTLIYPGDGSLFGTMNGLLGAARHSFVSRFTSLGGSGSSYTPPALPFPSDGSDLYVNNWDTIDGDFVVAKGTGGITAYIPSRSTSIVTEPIRSVDICDLGVEDGTGQAGNVGIVHYAMAESVINRVRGSGTNPTLFDDDVIYSTRSEIIHQALFATCPMGVIKFGGGVSDYKFVTIQGGGFAIANAGDVITVTNAVVSFESFCAYWVANSHVKFAGLLCDSEGGIPPDKIAGMVLTGQATVAGVKSCEVSFGPGPGAAKPLIMLDDVQQATFLSCTLDISSDNTCVIDCKLPPRQPVMLDGVWDPSFPLTTSRTIPVFVPSRETLGRTQASMTSGSRAITPDEWSFGVLELTGSPGADFTATVPKVDGRTRVVRNATSKIATVAPDGGGTSVTIAAGALKGIYCDGTNLYAP